MKLNSYISNKMSYEKISLIFDEICLKSFDKNFELKNIDKFSILLHLYIFFVNPILKLSAKNNENGSITYEILLRTLIDQIKKYDLTENILPNKLYYDDAGEILKETNMDINNIKKHIEKNKILLFNIPDFIKGIPKVYLNCFDNTLFYLCKLIYTTDLMIFYKKIKILKKDFNFLLSEIYEMNPKELDIFINTK